MEVIQHPRADEKSGGEEKDRRREHAAIRQVGDEEREEKRESENEKRSHPMTLHRRPITSRPA